VTVRRAFISLDLEGLPHVVSREHLFVKGSLYAEARKIATEVVKVVAETLHENRVDEVIVTDSHGPMVNIPVDEMPGYVKLVRGFQRQRSMVAGARGATLQSLSTTPRLGLEKPPLITHTVEPL